VSDLLPALVVSLLSVLPLAPARDGPGSHQPAIPAVAATSRNLAGGLQQKGGGQKPPKSEDEAAEAAERERKKREEEKAREEEPEPHTSFVKRVLIDGGVGFENRYRKPLAGIGIHVAFLKVGKFFVGAPGVMLAAAPDWVDVRVVENDRTVSRTVLKRQATLLLTQSFSWQLETKDYGYIYFSFIAIKRLPMLDSKWDPAVAISFTPR